MEKAPGDMAAGRQLGFQGRAAGGAYEFVGIQGQQEIPSKICLRPLHELGGAAPLLEAGAGRLLDAGDGEPFGFQQAQDAARFVYAAVVNDIKPVNERERMANERLDDVGFVTRQGECGEVHRQPPE